MNNVIKISGLDCANCARELEEEISKIVGVESATVDFVAQKVYVDCNDFTLEKVKDCCNNFEEVKVVEESAKGEKIKIKGLCCANCARELEEELNKIEGVSAVVDFMNMTVVLNASPEGRKKAVYAITHFEDVKIVNEQVKKSFAREKLADIICIALSVLFFIPAFVLDLTGLMESSLALQITSYIFFGIAYLSVGYKVLWFTAKNIIKGKIFDENFLMTIASVGAILLGIFEGEGFAEGVAVMLLYQIGELLQAAA
ncbi:MAG: cation transporter, partial [Clostridia bacterium]|nr:cation transporter [Clostridia bacterium]